MSMSKKDYEVVAKAIAALPDVATKQDVATYICAALQGTNPAFRPNTFMHACLEPTRQGGAAQK